jgi:hypothetical protein
MTGSNEDPQRVIGRTPDRLTLKERYALAGKYIALQVYTPEEAPLRRIEAIATTVEECIRQLATRGLDPLRFEFSRLQPPY